MNAPMWTVEMHAHTIYSRDCLLKLDKIPEIAQQAQLDKVAITDHNTADGALQLARMYPMWVIPGEEIMTTQGEILAWYIKETVPSGLSPTETIGRLREQGAVVGIAHPFDRYRKGAWKADDLGRIIHDVDALEVFNSRCVRSEDNAKALEYALQNNVLMTCGSDAHTGTEYGRSTMRVAPFANNADGLRAALKVAEREEQLSGFGVHLASTYAKHAKRLISSLR